MEWISVKERLPDRQDYFAVKFATGVEDEKPFRIREGKRGFLVMEEITHWREIDWEKEHSEY